MRKFTLSFVNDYCAVFLFVFYLIKNTEQLSCALWSIAAKPTCVQKCIFASHFLFSDPPNKSRNHAKDSLPCFQREMHSHYSKIKTEAL